MQPSRRRLTRLAAEQLQAASASAAAGPSQPAAQGLPAALLRQLSSATSALGAPHTQSVDSSPAAAAQRRRSHSAARTSGRPLNSSAPAAAQRSSSSSSVTAAPARTKSTMAPAMATALPAQQHAAVQQALQAAARLVRQADARREAAHSDLDRPLPSYEELRGPHSRRRFDAEDDGMSLKRAANYTGETEERDPVWVRATAAQSAAPATESHAALALYRQEVLHGHDPEVALASSGSFVHVPFLRSGMFAAHQGYGLQSELSRVRLQSRVLGPQAAIQAAVAADGEFAAAAERSASSSAITGLQSVMEASRRVDGEGEEVKRGRGRPRTRPVEPPRPKIYGTMFGTTPEQHSSLLPVLPGLTVAVATPEELKMCLSEGSKQVLRSDAAVLEEDLSEELVDAAAAQRDWEAHLTAAASGAAAAARAVGAGDSTLSPASPSRNFQYEQLKPQPPAASCAAVLEALGRLEGVDVSGPNGIGEAVSRLWRPFRTRARGGYPVPLLPVEPPSEPEACLQSMLAMARLLIEDLGVDAFTQVVCKVPWVLLLDGHMHGQPQLEALHVLEMDQERRAEFVLKHPRILQTDVEAGLLPTFEYLQSLGMSSEQMYQCLVADPTYGTPAALPRLKAVAAFWLGKGMTKSDLIQTIATWPKFAFSSSISERELKYDWLADHVGVTVEDVAAMPSIMHRSLLDTIGPRIGFLLSKGYKIQLPSQAKAGAAELDDSIVPLGRLLNYAKPTFFSRFKTETEEFEAFKADWLQADLPAWLEQRKPGIDYYRSLTGNRQQHSIKHIEEQRRQQQQEAREAFAAAELDYECAAFA